MKSFLKFIILNVALLAGEQQSQAVTTADTLRTRDLQELIVTAVRNNFKVKPGHYVYDVASDSTLRDASTFDAFKRVPILNVSDSGMITSLQGKTLRYKVNGLTDPMLSGDIQNALLSLKAKYVIRIELVENPDGDDPNLLEVNIVTKGRLEGYQAMVTARGSDTGLRSTLWGLTKVRNFTMSVGYAYLLTHDHDTENISNEWRYSSPLQYYKHQKDTDGGYRAQMHSVEIPMSYSFDDNTILSASCRIIGKVNPHSTSLSRTSVYGADMTPTAIYSRTATQKMDDKEYEIHLDFERLLGKHDASDGKFYLGYEFYYRPIISHTYADFAIERCDDPLLMPDYDVYHRIGRTNMTMHTAMAELRRTFREKHTVYATAVYRYRDNNSADSLGNASWEHTSLLQNSATINLAYKYSTRKFMARASIGGRLYDDKIKTERYDFSRTSWLWQPAVSASYVPGGKVSYELGYTMTAQVPDITAMNPYVYRDIPGQLTFGNPNLKPETAHSLSLGANINLSRMYLGLTLEGQMAGDLVLQYRHLDADNVLNITYDNIASRQMLTFSPFINWWATQTTNIRFSAATDFVRYSSRKLAASNSGFQFHPNLTVSQSLPWKLSLELSGRYNTAWVGLQGKGGQNYDYGLSLVRSFLQRRLRVTVDASAFVPVYYNRTYTTVADDYRLESTTRRFHANFSLKIAYRFGKLRASVKETESTVSNTDIKTTYDE